MKLIITLIALISTQFFYSQSCSSITATDLFGNTSAQISCGTGGCVELTTNVPKTFLTTSYNVTSQAYAPAIPFNRGTPLNANTDDSYSDIIPLPFNFCFYGGTYNKIVISTNGSISFDTKEAGLTSNPNLLADNPSPLLPKNSIFGLMQDLIFSDTDDSEIYYTVTGSAPCRKFVINYYKARLTGCTETSTFQIVLSEFSNEIDINIENKPLPCVTARFKESLIGTLNADGNDGLSPPARNRGVWQSGNESWKYTPAGNQVQPSATWKNTAGQVVGSSINFNACPTKTEKYTVTLNYLVCGVNFSISDDIDVTYSQVGGAPIINSPINFSDSLCDNNADNTERFDWATLVRPLVTSDPTVDVKFYTSQSAAEIGGAGISSISGGQYTVYARVTNASGCYTIGIVNMNITFLDKIEAIDIKKLYCFDGTEDFTVHLDQIYPEMLITPISEIKEVTFYNTENDATVPNTDEKILPEQLLEEDGDHLTYVYFVRFENADGCFTVKKITIELRNPIAEKDHDICDFQNDGTENVTLSILNGAIAGSQPVTVSYFSDAPSANADTGEINTFLLTSANSPAIIYVRLDMEADNGDCYRVYPITLTLVGSPVLSKESVTANLGLICDNNDDGSEPYDLTQHQPEIYSGSEVFTYNYYRNYNPANRTFSGAISDPTAFPLTENTDVYVQVSRGACYAVAKITINFNFLPTVKIQPAILSICDRGNDYGETYDLNDAKANMFLTAQNTDTLADMDVTYYETREDAVLGTNIKSNFQTTFDKTITFWARFESKNTHCFSVSSIALITEFPPKAIPSTIQVCDSNLDGNPEVNLLLPEYTRNMVSETDPAHHFMFYLTEADVLSNNQIKNPENFSPVPFPSRIYVLVENLVGCFTLPATIDFTLGKVLPVNQSNFSLEQCDESNDGLETLNLTQFENDIYNSTATFSYYPTLVDLNKNTNKIATPSAYPYDNKVHSPFVYVRVENGSFCPALVKIDIVLKNTPVFELPTYNFCPGVGITIEPDLSYLDPEEYIWKNPAGEIISRDPYIANIKVEGQYSLTIRIANKCTYTEYFDVIAYEVPIITELVSLSNTSYKVIATGSRKIVYSIDGTQWQDSNIFENITPGAVRFYVRFEDSECLGVTRDGLSVNVNNAITPNDDGVNDKWIFNDLNVFQDRTSNVKIYDRNGILVFEQTSNKGFNWDGKIRGRSLPTASYWYIITLPDKVINGWILLKNRN